MRLKLRTKIKKQLCQSKNNNKKQKNLVLTINKSSIPDTVLTECRSVTTDL